MRRRPTILSLTGLLAASLALTACHLPTWLPGAPEGTVDEGRVATLQIGGRTITLRTADGKAIADVAVLVNGKTYRAQDGKLYLPDSVVRDALAHGSILVFATGYMPAQATLAADTAITLVPLVGLAVGPMVPAEGGAAATANNAARVQFPAGFLAAGARVSLGRYQPAGGVPDTAFAQERDAFLAKVGANAPRGCDAPLPCAPVSTALGLYVAVDGATQGGKLVITYDLDRLLADPDKQQAQAAARILQTFQQMDATGDPSWRKLLADAYGISLDGHRLTFPVTFGNQLPADGLIRVDVQGFSLLGSHLEVTLASSLAGGLPPEAGGPPPTAAENGNGTAGSGQSTGGQPIAAGNINLVAAGTSNLAAGSGLLSQGGNRIVAGGGGNFISQNGGAIVAGGGGNIVAGGGGNIVAGGGGNFISQNGGAIVAGGGGNIIAQGGGNVVSNDGGSLVDTTIPGIIAQGGGNIVAQGGGNIVAQGGGNFTGEVRVPFDPPAAAAGGPGAKYHLRNFTDNLWPGATVTVLNAPAPVPTATTDGAGHYTLAGLPAIQPLVFLEVQAGSYTLRTMADRPADGQSVTADVNAATAAVSSLVLLELLVGDVGLPQISSPGYAADVALVHGLMTLPEAQWVAQQPNTLAGLINVATFTRNLLHLNGATLQCLPPQVVTLSGDGTTAQFNNPAGITLMPNGDMLVADHLNSRVALVPAGGGSPSTYAGFGGGGLLDGALSVAQLQGPAAVAATASGNYVYIADDIATRLRRVATATSTMNTLIAVPPIFGDLSVLTGVVAADMGSPRGVAVDAAGNIYVAETGQNKIVKVAPSGTTGTIAGSGTSGYLDSIGSSARFNGPKGVAVDATGNVYVADTGNNAVRKIAPSGVVSTIGAAGAFNQPHGIAVDLNGVVYVTEAGGQDVKLITPSGTIVTLAGSGTAGYQDGAAASARFDAPKGITVDAFGNVYVTDANNRRIRRIR